MKAVRLFCTLAMGLLPLSTATVAAPLPNIPIESALYHWDHHWFMWLPQHPQYESIEVMSVDAPNPIVWVFFTDRAAPKRQTHYLNQQEMADHWSGKAYFREIEYATQGKAGQPLGLTIRLVDEDNQPVSWHLEFPPDATLRPAGLTDQSGHGAAEFFLLFFREQSAATDKSVVQMGTRNYFYSKADKAPFPPAYSANVFTATLAFRPFQVFGKKGGLIADSLGHVFRRSQTPSGLTFLSDPLGYKDNVELTVTPEMSLARYIQHADTHVLRIELAPPLSDSARPRSLRLESTLTLRSLWMGFRGSSAEK